MGEFKYLFARFDQDVNKFAIDNEFEDRTIFLFPTFQSKKAAKAYQLKNFPFCNIKFLTIEEWKNELFPAKNLVLKGIKRTLALFNSFKVEDREYFKLNDFSGFKKFAERVFNFWEEIKEERIKFSDIENLLYISQGGADWQFEMLSKLQENYELYRQYLLKNDFTDPVFQFDFNNLDETAIEGFTKIVVVNQFYFSKLEQNILHKLSDKNITICYQIPEEFVDKKNLKINYNFSAKYISSFLTKKIGTIRCDDKFSQISALFNLLNKESIENIVDFNFFQNNYSHFFSKRFFKLKPQKKFSNSSLYKFFSEISGLITSLIHIKEKGEYLISLERLKDSLLSNQFVSYFIEKGQDQATYSISENIKNYLYELIERNYNYVNINGNFLQWHNSEPAVKKIFSQLFSVIKEILKIDTINEFVNFLDEKIIIEKIISPEEKKYSDILKIYQQTLLDFKSIARLNLLRMKYHYFGSSKNQNQAIRSANQLLKLFLEHLRPGKINYNITNQNDERVSISNLHATRNLQFDSLAILNVNEGILPPTKQSTFLLFENQRKKLGLKSYEDIVLREKYYFFRLIAQTENIHIFHIEDINANINTSSFLEELMLYFPKTIFDNRKYCIHDYNSLYQTILEEKTPVYQVKPSSVTGGDFFRFSLDDNKITKKYLSTFTPTKWLQLARNPFLFYIKYILGYDELQTAVSSYFNLRFVGLFAHKLFEIIWEQLKLKETEIKFSDVPALLAEAKFQKKINKELYTNLNLKYKKFNSSSDYYLLNIYINILLQNIKSFFKQLAGHLEEKSVNTRRIHTERSGLSLENLPVFFTADSFNDLKVSLSGRTDLLIDDKDFKILVDYKTAKFNVYQEKDYRQQIFIYALIYFILPNKTNYSKIKSFLYFIGDDNLYGVSVDKNSIAKFKDKMNKMLSHIKENGYETNLSDSYDIPEITRSDLL